MHITDCGWPALAAVGIDPAILPGTAHQDKIAIAEPRSPLWIAAVKNVFFAGLLDTAHNKPLGELGDFLILLHISAGLAE